MYFSSIPLNKPFEHSLPSYPCHLSHNPSIFYLSYLHMCTLILSSYDIISYTSVVFKILYRMTSLRTIILASTEPLFHSSKCDFGRTIKRKICKAREEKWNFASPCELGKFSSVTNITSSWTVKCWFCITRLFCEWPLFEQFGVAEEVFYIQAVCGWRKMFFFSSDKINLDFYDDIYKTHGARRFFYVFITEFL